jgi:uncharacterized MAPEG superfamily protein
VVRPGGGVARPLSQGPSQSAGEPAFLCIRVLCARAVGVSNSLAVLGAEIFLFARLIHVASYAAGVIVVRTIAHHTGTLGTLLIAFELFTRSR